jgi:uncharacterized protein (DUF1697 family)
MSTVPTYVAFLRAINLGKARKVPMADLRACLAEAGLRDVETHIQTGNVRVGTSMRSVTKVEKLLEELLLERYGFEIPTIAFTTAELARIRDDALAAVPPRGNATGELRYVHLFKTGDVPTGDVAAAIAAWDRPGEAGVVIGRAVHLWLDGATQQARFLNTFKKALAPGTNRNLKVITAVAERWA